MAEELDALMLDLDNAAAVFYAARDAKRPALDRYRDFRHVFLGSEAGQRVLDDILHMCRVHGRTAVKGDPLETYFREGQRVIGVSILLTIRDEPKERVTQQRTREED